MENLKQLQDEWYQQNAPLGKMLGYPECCIREFCAQPPQLLRRSKPTEDDKLRYKAGCVNGEFTGFIPCINHARQILNREITLESLIKNRYPKFLPFPYAM
jgi:hypothetical protein